MAGQYVRMPLQDNPDDMEDSRSESGLSITGPESTQDAAQASEPTVQEFPVQLPNQEQSSTWPTDHRLKVLEKAIVDMAQIMIEKEALSRKPQQCDPNWGYIRGDANENGTSQPVCSTIRLEQLRPFPKNVPSNRLWQEWRKYLENFEIAASLQPILEPDKLAKVLFLAVGEDMQAIIRAAKLRPSLEGPDCYNVFVNNVDAHLRTMRTPQRSTTCFWLCARKSENRPWIFTPVWSIVQERVIMGRDMRSVSCDLS